MARHRTTLFYLIGFLLWASIAVRALFTLLSAGHPLWWIVAGLLLAYLLLMLSERRLTPRFAWYPGIYLSLQTLLIVGLALVPPLLDYYVLLFVPLSVQAMWLFPRRAGYAWIGIFSLVMAGMLLYGIGWIDGLPFVLLYGAAYLFVAYYATVTEQADAARRESQTLYAELQEAYRQLQEYAAHAGELAAVQERSRLSRDLHDSVTQLLYSLTLYAEAAARQLATGNVKLVESQLREMRTLARQALQEMRLLVFELRPPLLEKEGLAAALQARLEAVESRSGLKTELRVEGDGRLPPEIEMGMYRIAQEALNNLLKHAQARRVAVNLRLDRNPVTLEIADDGIGFDQASLQGRSGLGLRGMQERAEQLGGQLSLISRPGEGTRVKLEVVR